MFTGIVTDVGEVLAVEPRADGLKRLAIGCAYPRASILRALVVQYGGGPVGIGALAASVNEEEDTLTDVVEPFLIQIGFLQRTAGGRRATAKAKAHLGLTSGDQPRLL